MVRESCGGEKRRKKNEKSILRKKTSSSRCCCPTERRVTICGSISKMVRLLLSCTSLITMAAAFTGNTPLSTKNTSLEAVKSNDNSAPPLKSVPPRKVCLMVEPTPFTHVSGYANRFNEMLKFLAKAGDEVEVRQCFHSVLRLLILKQTGND